ncbi:MAG: ABC transporter substrate binding protein [Desulfobulbus sp.]
MNIPTRLTEIIVTMAGLIAALATFALAEIHPLKNVLIINSYHPGFLWSDEEEAGAVEQLRDTIPSVDIPVEYLDAKRYPGKSNLSRMKDLLIDKYHGKKIDLIIALDDPAVEMLTDYPTELFPEVPVVFAGITTFGSYASKGRKRITGVLEEQDLQNTIDTALRLHPDTAQILAISDSTISGIAARRALEALQPNYAGRVSIRFLPACTFEEAQAAVAALPSNSLVLINTYATDSSGNTLSTKDSTRMIAAAARVPVYGVHQNRLGYGIVGGYLLSGKEQGKRAVDVGFRILGGENPDDIAIEETRTSIALFDYEQMERFGISPAALPRGSVIINKPESVFVTHRKFALTVTWILLVVVALLFLAFFLVRLLQARAALRKKTEELDRIFSLSLDLLCITSQDGRFIRLNPAWETTLGYRLGELEGKAFIGLVHPDDVAATHAMAKVSKDTNIIDFTNRYRGKDGSYRWLEWRSKPDCKSSLIYSVARDVTQRKQLEQSLRESESFQRALLQAIPDLIWLKDAKGVYLVCNAMFERLYGAKEADIVGKTDYDFVDKPLADFFGEHDRIAIAAGKPTSNEESVVFADDGHGALLETVKTPMFDDQGNLIGVLGVARDITERKNAEEEKAKLKSQLEQAQKMESVGRLAGGVAHDFNNMLGVILGYGELASQQAGADQQLQSALQQIIKAAQHSADITRQLLAFARKQTISPKIVDMNKAVESMIKMLQRLIGEDIDLAWLPGPDLWAVMIDPGQIDQVLANLCVNARDAISDVGKVTIETGNAEFDEAYCSYHYGFQPGEYVFLTVSDNGCGMDSEIVGHIFEPFFTTKASSGGTGLGLATVYGIVRQNNGFINVYSEPGQGTTFKIYLPRHQVDACLFPQKSSQRPVKHGHETILLVEDEPMILDLVTMMLETLGYTILVARTPAGAVKLAREHAGEIHLLLTDVIMPEMNGRDLAKDILAVHANLKVLFMSGYTANVIAHHGVLDGGVHFIQKPFSREALAAKIREALEGEAA